MKQIIRIGSRASRLAVLQSELVMEQIRRILPDAELELVTMKTTGDKILNRALDQIGGKGLFLKELDAALLAGAVDLCVHSLKDVPMELPKELPLLAFSCREDPRDVLVLPEGVAVNNVHLSDSLHILSYRMNEKELFSAIDASKQQRD